MVGGLRRRNGALRCSDYGTSQCGFRWRPQRSEALAERRPCLRGVFTAIGLHSDPSERSDESEPSRSVVVGWSGECLMFRGCPQCFRTVSVSCHLCSPTSTLVSASFVRRKSGCQTGSLQVRGIVPTGSLKETLPLKVAQSGHFSHGFPFGDHLRTLTLTRSERV